MRAGHDERTAAEKGTKERRAKNRVDLLERREKNLRPVFTSTSRHWRGLALCAHLVAGVLWFPTLLVSRGRLVPPSPLAGAWFFGPHRNAGLGRSDRRRPHEVDRSMSFWVSVCVSVGVCVCRWARLQVVNC